MSTRTAIRRTGRNAALRATDGFGRVTASARVLPSFLIVGGQRCGTTSMYKTLAQHPAVLPAGLRKGIHFFDMRYDRGLDWYRSHFPLRSTVARVERATGVPAISGESSPYYGFHPLAAYRIASDLPGVRLLVLIRDPSERAYSAYTHERARGYETETFERALDLEPERLAGEAERLAVDPRATSHDLQHHGYVTRGRYVEQLERLEEIFGRGRLCVVDSQDFFTDPATAFARVTDFLGLPDHPGTVFDQHNARPRSSLDPTVRERLRREFAASDERLVEWLGWTPSWLR
jgi:Sulfotransferase domain